VTERRVLVTGAGGFVGQAVATGFADLGWSVTGLDRAFDEGQADARIRRVQADVERVLPFEAGGVGPQDLVVHGAWITADPDTLGMAQAEYEAKNLAPTEAVLSLCSEVGAAALVFLSSSGVFASDDGDTALRDTHEPTGDSPYARAKRKAEALTFEALGGAGTVPHVVRLGYLYGPGECARPSRPDVSLVARWIAAARAAQPLEVRRDDPARDWTFAPDLAEALQHIAQSPSAGHPIHLGSPHVYRDSDVVGVIASEFPASEVTRVPAGPTVKPPMRPTDLPALAEVDWTGLRSGVRRILEAEVLP
jgi:nucleoside-diphosphate-sugar epimerase